MQFFESEKIKETWECEGEIRKPVKKPAQS